jgi:hypothetical protein
VADTVLKAAISEKPNFRYTVGEEAETVMNLKKLCLTKNSNVGFGTDLLKERG